MAVESKSILKAVGIEKSFYNPKKVSVIKGVDLDVQSGDTAKGSLQTE